MTQAGGEQSNGRFGFERSERQYIEPLMGWTADDDPMAHVVLRFHSLAQAIRYAKQNRLDYCVH
jgi:hypothetical protein